MRPTVAATVAEKYKPPVVAFLSYTAHFSPMLAKFLFSARIYLVEK